MIKAILFDMDGIIYDSMQSNAKAWFEAMKTVNIDSSINDFYLLEGRTANAIIDILFQQSFGKNSTNEDKFNIYSYKQKRFNELEPDGAKPMKDVIQVLNIVKDMGIERVIVTGSSQQSLFDRLEENFPKIFDRKNIVSGHDVKLGKPHPEPYLTGLEKVRIAPHEAIVIENAPLGIQAAKAAGIYTIAVNTGPLSDSLLKEAGADLIYSCMHDLSIDLEAIIKNRSTITP